MFLFRTTGLPEDWSPDALDRNNTGKRIQFKFVQAKVQDWFTTAFDELALDTMFNCPYILSILLREFHRTGFLMTGAPH